MKLQKIIHQLSPTDYSNLSNQFKETRADKFLLLLNHYRIAKTPDEELLLTLEIKQTAFYTLKSRLFDKIQEFLYKNTADTRIELLQNVANIEHLVYQTQRETAIGILKKLETELIEHDMPNELTTVYKALQKLHVHSAKYYDYLKLYNQHVAFNLAHDKAEGILLLFSKTLGEYYLDKNSDKLELLLLYKKEMANVCRLYKSHHLQVYQNILITHFSLFCPIDSESTNDSTIEEMLKESLLIIETHPQDRTYKHFIHIINFLYFEYYHKLKLYKNASKYYELLSSNFETILLCNHCSFINHFLISKIEYFVQEGKQADLINEEDVYSHDPNTNDLCGFIFFHCYKASAEYYAEKHAAALQTLNDLMNEVSFKNIPYAELEIKSFMAIIHIICGKFEQAEIIIRSISRKITDEDNNQKYQNAIQFLKLMKTAVSVKKIGKREKIIKINNSLKSTNLGEYSFLQYLKLDEKTILEIMK
ncbi:hypothetical protein BH10BAC1_BH10BAC1_11860 [soil metagenome]